MSEFQGFTPDAMRFLSTLGTKKPAWFKAHKKEYQQWVADPVKGFVSALGEALRAGSYPEIVAEPKTNGSIAPINNDLRFAPDKSPYKDHLLIKFWEGRDKKSSPTLYVRIAPSGVGFATGAVFTDLARWRAAVAGERGAALQKSLVKLLESTRADVAGEALKRVPAPYDADHPRADLLRYKLIQVRWQEKSPAALAKPAFVSWCAKRLEGCADIHHWLVRELG